MSDELNTTCDIYRREVEKVRASGDYAALAAMVETWYARCEFKKCVNGARLIGVGVRDNGNVWLKTNRGTVEFCAERDRWRMVEHGADPLYMMARIAEITQVPFAYLCGVRDAVTVLEESESNALSAKIKRLRREDKALACELRRKGIAVDAVAVAVCDAKPACGVNSFRYPDAPSASLTWGQMRKHYHSTPGVYFAWSGGRIVYVGATERGMHSRLSSGHHAVTSKDTFSFVELPANEVYFAETCYVARYAPERNACVAQANGVRQGGSRGKRKERKPSMQPAAVPVGHKSSASA